MNWTEYNYTLKDNRVTTINILDILIVVGIIIVFILTGAYYEK